MAELIITHRQKDYLLKMPYQVIINGRLAGVMRTPQARLFISWMEQFLAPLLASNKSKID